MAMRVMYWTERLERVFCFVIGQASLKICTPLKQVRFSGAEHHGTSAYSPKFRAYFQLSSLIQTILLAPELTFVSPAQPSCPLRCGRVAGCTASREFHPAPKKLQVACAVVSRVSAKSAARAIVMIAQAAVLVKILPKLFHYSSRSTAAPSGRMSSTLQQCSPNVPSIVSMN